MRDHLHFIPLLLATALLALLLPASGRVAYAAGAALQLEVGAADNGATRVPVTASLVNEAGQPIPNARIIFMVGGERDGEARTDAKGQAIWRIRRNLTAGTYTVEALLDGAPGTHASTQLAVAPAQISLQLSSEKPQIGDALSMTALLTTAAGKPLSGASIALSLNGERQGVVRTDEQGYAEWPLGRKLAAGVFAAEAVFDGQLPALAAKATRSFTIAPAQVEVRTEPPLPGTSFALDGRVFTAGADGVARISVDRMGVYSLTVASRAILRPDTRSEFTGWDDDSYAPERSVQIPAKAPLEAGFDIFYLITPKLTRAQHDVVDPQRVSSLTLMSSIGQRVRMDRIEPTWIQGSQVVAGPDHLETRPISYTVESVLIDGANVVNQSQQRFLPSTQQDLSIDVMLYSVRFSARDALFGFPIKSGIDLTYPDGHTQQFALGPDGQVSADSLARGSYRVKLDSPGLGTARPLVLSRDQDLPIMLLSYLDLAVVFGSLGAFALGLLLLGRRLRRLKPLNRRARPLPAPAGGEPQDRESLALSED